MTDNAAAANLLELVADITVAWLSNPKTTIPATDLPAVIGTIHGALSGLSAPAEAAPAAQAEYTPAVTVRRSLASKDHVISLIDGKPYRTLRRHLAAHGLTPEQYRERYNLKPDYPMVSENYAIMRRDLAKKIGLGRKPEAKPAKVEAKPAKAPKPEAPKSEAPKSETKAAKPAKAEAKAAKPAAKAAKVANPEAKAAKPAAKPAPRKAATAAGKPANGGRKQASTAAPALVDGE